LPKVARGGATYTIQGESKRQILPQRSPEDGKIDWRWSAHKTYNLIRAQTRPYPGAFTHWGQEKIKIWKASLPGKIDDNHSPTGTNVDDMPDVSGVCGVICGD
jgi:methionyl-tRNA formyltransferase